MSPEQARGKKIDHRSDIYALGVMIHEMLTGMAPFSGESVMDVLHAHVSEPPPRMSSVCPDLPRELDAPVLAMLEKRPKDRPPTAGQAVAALAEHMGAVTRKSLDAPPPSIPRERQMAETLELAATQQSPASTPAAAGRSGPSTVSSSAVESPRANGPQGSALRRWAIPLALLGIAIGASIWSFARSPGSAPPEAPAAPSALALPAPAPSPSLSQEAPPAITPSSAFAPAAMIQVRLSTRPADVEVWLGDGKLGTSGAPIALPRGNERIELRLKKTGYQDESLELVPDRDQSLGASLSPLPARREGQPESPKAAGHKRMERILGARD
jgi:serine/threonine-protein kinase